MDFRLFINRIKSLILDPDKAWEAIYSENRPTSETRNNFLYPLLILGTLSAFFGSFLFSYNELRSVYFVLSGVKYFLLMTISVYITALIFIRIAKVLNIKCDFSTSFKLIIYSMIPLFLCQILSRIFESFIFVNILSLYGLYIFWTGTEKLLNPKDNKKIQLLIASIVTFLVTFLLTNWLLTRIIDRIYFSFFA